MNIQTTRIASRSSSAFGRNLRSVSSYANLKRGLALLSILVIIHYISLLIKIHSNVIRKDGHLDSLPPVQKKGKGNTPATSKPNSIEHKVGELPSAKWLLDRQPPFQDSDIIKLYPDDSETKPLIKSDNTVVTGYFRVRSKYRADKYDGWMRNMLSLQDAMVIFTEPDLVDQIKDLRSHAVNRTIIVPISLDDLPIGKLFSESFWQDQLERDPEKKIHRSYQLFWIWLSKSWSVAQAIRMNVYDSDLFVWSDIGCFRDRNYNSKTLVMHRESVPPHEILQMAHHKPNPPSEELFNDKYKHKANFYHSGSQFVGYKNTLLKFHEYFLETIDRFLEKSMIIVEDQAVLQSVCLSHPEICAYAPFTQVKDNHYFGLRHILHFGGDYDYWRLSSKK